MSKSQQNEADRLSAPSVLVKPPGKAHRVGSLALAIQADNLPDDDYEDYVSVSHWGMFPPRGGHFFNQSQGEPLS